jgi:hypothetical protein
MAPDGSGKLRLFLSLRLLNLLRGTVKRSKAVPEDSFACSFHLQHSRIITGKTCIHRNYILSQLLHQDKQMLY